MLLNNRVRLLLVMPVVLLAVLGLAGGSGAAGVAPGSLDPSFGSGGIVLTNLGTVVSPYYGARASHDHANAVAVQPDGKIVAAGDTDAGGGDFALVRYNPDGGLDTGFGVDGKVLTDLGFGGTDNANAVAIQPDGKIVAAGFGTTGDRLAGVEFALVRYNRDGSLDSSFGSGGKVLTAIGAIGGIVEAISIQSDGKIVAVGVSGESEGSGEEFALVRYNRDGSLDSSFGSGGKVLTDIGASLDQANAVAIQPDGKIVAAGFSVVLGPGSFDFALIRYNPDGSLDSSFGSGGKVLTDIIVPLSLDKANAVAIQPDGKIIALGSGQDGPSAYFTLVRYNSDGSLDSSFGSGGKVLTNTGGDGQARAIALDPSGKIVAAGTSDALGIGVPGIVRYDFEVVHYNLDGSLDSGFGVGGIVQTDFGFAGRDEANAVAIQPDGEIVAAGFSTAETNGPADFALARYGGASHTLAVGRDGTGSGSVSSMPAGISCGADCGAEFADATSVTLTAVAAAGSVFSGWSGDCTGTGPCTVSMSADRDITATFDAAPTPGGGQSSGGGGGGGGGGGYPDLQLVVTSDSTVAPAVGSPLVYHLTVSDRPSTVTASQVLVDVALPAGMTVTSTYADRGPGCKQATGGLVCDLDWISPDTVGHITISGMVGTAGAQTATASVRHWLQDGNPADNTTSLTLSSPIVLPSVRVPSQVSGGALSRAAILGRARVGSTLRVKPPRWSTPPTKVTYRWQLCSAKRCAVLKGATKTTLKVRPGWLGRSVRLVVTAHFNASTSTSTSAVTALVKR